MTGVILLACFFETFRLAVILTADPEFIFTSVPPFGFYGGAGQELILRKDFCRNRIPDIFRPDLPHRNKLFQ